MREGAPLRPDVGHSEPSCGVKINATSCLLDILTAGLPSWRRVASLSLGPSVPWRAYAPATRSPRHQNGCEAEPGTCWGMLRANHFVNRHEQGVRTMGRAGRAHSGTAGLRQNRGGQKFAALVVRREYSTNPRLPGRASDVLGGIQGSTTGVRARYWGTQIPFLSLSRAPGDHQRGG